MAREPHQGLLRAAALCPTGRPFGATHVSSHRTRSKSGPQVGAGGAGEFDTHPCLCYILTAVGDRIASSRSGKARKWSAGIAPRFLPLLVPASPECEEVR